MLKAALVCLALVAAPTLISANEEQHHNERSLEHHRKPHHERGMKHHGKHHEGGTNVAVNVNVGHGSHHSGHHSEGNKPEWLREREEEEFEGEEHQKHGRWGKMKEHLSHKLKELKAKLAKVHDPEAKEHLERKIKHLEHLHKRVCKHHKKEKEEGEESEHEEEEEEEHEGKHKKEHESEGEEEEEEEKHEKKSQRPIRHHEIKSKASAMDAVDLDEASVAAIVPTTASAPVSSSSHPHHDWNGPRMGHRGPLTDAQKSKMISHITAKLATETDPAIKARMQKRLDHLQSLPVTSTPAIKPEDDEE